MTWLSVSDLADRYGKTEQAIYNMRHRGDLPAAMRVGRTLRWREDLVEQWENEMLADDIKAAS